MLQNAMPKPPTKDELRAAADAAIKSGVEVRKLPPGPKPEREWSSRSQIRTMTVGQLNTTGAAHGHHHSNKHRAASDEHEKLNYKFAMQRGVCPHCDLAMWLPSEGKVVAAERLGLPLSGQGWQKAMQARMAIFHHGSVICRSCTTIETGSVT